jgi:4'-phosphopantetheinyl transferase
VTTFDDHQTRGAVSVWSANLDELPCRRDLLTSDELARSQRFCTQQLSDRYIAGRSWLRSVLGSAIGTPPASLQFRYLPLGKPVLDHPAISLHFSLAHSAEVALLAVGGHGALGVDVERVTAGAYEPASADLVLSADELRWIEHHADRDRAFLRCWVRKEAYAKVGGMGMDRHLSALTLTGAHSVGEIDGRVVRDLAIGDNLAAAVAVPEGRRVLYRGRWSAEEAA